MARRFAWTRRAGFGRLVAPILRRADENRGEAQRGRRREVTRNILEQHRFAGRDATVRLKLPIEGRRRYMGRVVGVEQGRVVLESEGKRHHIAFEDIDRARLVPDV